MADTAVKRPMNPKAARRISKFSYLLQIGFLARSYKVGSVEENRYFIEAEIKAIVASQPLR